MEQVLKTMLENVRAKTPLVHNITNYVTVNDVANVLLAAGGSPIMSDDADDVEDITSICGGRTSHRHAHKNTIPSMFLRRQEGERARAHRPARPCGRGREPPAHRHGQPPHARGAL